MNLNSNSSNLLDLRNLQEQVKRAFCYHKFFWPFTVQTFLHLSLFSACDPATCTGKEKECEGDVSTCKSGFKEDPAIVEPEGTDDCVSGALTTYQDFSVGSLYTSFLLLRISSAIFDVNTCKLVCLSRCTILCTSFSFNNTTTHLAWTDFKIKIE